MLGSSEGMIFQWLQYASIIICCGGFSQFSGYLSIACLFLPKGTPSEPKQRKFLHIPQVLSKSKGLNADQQAPGLVNGYSLRT